MHTGSESVFRLIMLFRILFTPQAVKKINLTMFEKRLAFAKKLKLYIYDN